MAEKHLDKFKDQLGEIDKIIVTPFYIRDFALTSLKEVRRRLEEQGITSPQQPYRSPIEHAIQGLSNIADKSIQSAFNTIYNQSCVLAVSALNSFLEEHFVNCINSDWINLKSNFPSDKKISFEELAEYDFNVKQYIGQILLKKDSSINFHDLQSMMRTYKHYFKKDINITEDQKKEIIFYQQCRHSIVHKNSIVDNDFMNGIGKLDANIKHYKPGNRIVLGKSDWENIKVSFIKVVEEATK